MVVCAAFSQKKGAEKPDPLGPYANWRQGTPGPNSCSNGADMLMSVPPTFLEFEKFVGQVCSLWNSGILGDPNVCMPCLLCLGSEGAGFEGSALHKLPSSSTPACFGLAGKDNASLSDVHHVGEPVG